MSVGKMTLDQKAWNQYRSRKVVGRSDDNNFTSHFPEKSSAVLTTLGSRLG
jgi:hypothetical protein